MYSFRLQILFSTRTQTTETHEKKFGSGLKSASYKYDDIVTLRNPLFYINGGRKVTKGTRNL